MDNEFYKPPSWRAPACLAGCHSTPNDAVAVLRPASVLTPSLPSLRSLLVLTPLAAAALSVGAQTLQPSSSMDPEAIPPRLRPARSLDPTRHGSEQKPALVLEADSLKSQMDAQTVAQGLVRLRYGDLLLRADQLSYDQVKDLARAEGSVEVSRNGTVVRGPSLQLYLEKFEGEFLAPQYSFALTGGSGHAKRLRFLDASRVQADEATYSSCPVEEGSGRPAWQLTTKQLRMNFDANEGVAEDAVLRFYGVPILAAPALSFPLGEGRKSGWLPPNMGLDNRSGFELGLPYYWNIAPQRDATITPFFMTRRGAGVDSEFRYLEPGHSGQLNLALLPKDRLIDRSRWDLRLNHDGELVDDWRYRWRLERVSDDEYWKDMPRRLQNVPQRLLPADFSLSRLRSYGWGEMQSYARVQRWQALQGLDETSQFETPYQRSPQVGLRLNTQADDVVLAGFRPWGRRARLEGGLELEYNRFDLATAALPQGQNTGERMHLLGHMSLPMGSAAWWLVPKLSINAARYRLDQPVADGRTSLGRSIPTFSLDHGWVFERNTTLFDRAMQQSLEPRLLYVRTPYRQQDLFPRFDSAAKDFNADSIYAENQFSGVDRVSDAHSLTAGVTSRWLDAAQGEEMLRLGLVQRFLFQDQRVTPDDKPVSQRVSDVLLLGAAHLDRRWWMDGALQYSPETGRTMRSVLRARYAPGPFRTVSVAYRLAREQSEQVELAWQWPLFGAAERPQRRSGTASCGGAWYSAGRVQYSMRDRRLTDSVVGFEYDAGCWVLRFGAERLSAGRAETNTRLLLQIELVGLSQLGSNALKVLKDNIPGYRQLSSDRSASSHGIYD